MIGQEREAGTEPGPECGLGLRRVDADDDELGVRELELVLQRRETAQVTLLLRTPPPARGEERDRIAVRELRQKPQVACVVGKVEVGEAGSGPKESPERIALDTGPRLTHAEWTREGRHRYTVPV